MNTYNTWYIEEKNLKNILGLNFGNVLDNFPNIKIIEHVSLMNRYNFTPISNRKRYDFAFEYGNKLYLIEVDWFWHYINPVNILTDDRYRNKNNLPGNVEVISIPYFIQFNKFTLPVLFPFLDNFSNFQTIFDWIDYSKFPCWFWSKNAVNFQTPAFFCKLWIERYNEDLLKFPDIVRVEIEKSLERCITELKKDKRVVYY